MVTADSDVEAVVSYRSILYALVGACEYYLSLRGNHYDLGQVSIDMLSNAGDVPQVYLALRLDSAVVSGKFYTINADDRKHEVTRFTIQVNHQNLSVLELIQISKRLAQQVTIDLKKTL